MRERLSISWPGYGDGDGAFPELVLPVFEAAVRFCRRRVVSVKFF